MYDELNLIELLFVCSDNLELEQFTFNAFESSAKYNLNLYFWFEYVYIFMSYYKNSAKFIIVEN